ncbi:MAG: hypothetical protein GF330_06285 [Candidatus Eisenbacteria bacterium]|nr:hypothetical protein [Candidatus Eisenbacteria bacterium]
MRYLLLALCTSVALAWIPSPATADWFEDFESYDVGDGLHGQGGWMGWDDDPAFDAYVTDVVAYSPTKAVEILPTTDIVRTFEGYTSGCWTFTAWQYIPGTLSGQTYFLLLNTYVAGTDYNWSCQVMFDETGFMESYPDGAQLPWVPDEWVEIRVEIDLDADLQRFFYDDQLLYEKSWVDGVSGDGAVNIACVDLYGNGASSIYYDDCSLIPGDPSPAGETTWGNVKSLFR